MPHREHPDRRAAGAGFGIVLLGAVALLGLGLLRLSQMQAVTDNVTPAAVPAAGHLALTQV